MSINFKNEIHDYLISHKDEIVETLMELIRVPSVYGDPLPGAPFGAECRKALDLAKDIYEQNGFESEMDSEGAYLLSYHGDGEKSLGLFAHADVVAPGDGWIYTQPFEPIVKDGYVIGRGAHDNKAAIVQSLYCAKAIKELNLPFKSKLVCFTGSNEEAGMKDVKSFVNNRKVPDFSLVCDGAFPIVRGDKGVYRFAVVSGERFSDILDFSGGKSKNVILGYVTVKIKFSEALYNELLEKADENFEISKDNDVIILNAKGISRHGAFPVGSVNAGLLAAQLLCRCKNLNENDLKILKIVEEFLGDYYGVPFGIDDEDPQFGKLTCSNGIIKLVDGCISLSYDTRHGLTTNNEIITEQLNKKMSEINWHLDDVSFSKTSIISEDNPYIQKCMESYIAFTGKTDAKTFLNAGGTYARVIPNSAETGVAVVKRPDFDMPAGHGGLHQPDEYLWIDGLIEGIEIVLQMLLACDMLHE